MTPISLLGNKSLSSTTFSALVLLAVLTRHFGLTPQQHVSLQVILSSKVMSDTWMHIVTKTIWCNTHEDRTTNQTQIISYSFKLHRYKQSFQFIISQIRKYFSPGTCQLNRNTHPAATAGGMTRMSLSCASCRASERWMSKWINSLEYKYIVRGSGSITGAMYWQEQVNK